MSRVSARSTKSPAHSPGRTRRIRSGRRCWSRVASVLPGGRWASSHSRAIRLWRRPSSSASCNSATKASSGQVSRWARARSCGKRRAAVVSWSALSWSETLLGGVMVRLPAAAEQLIIDAQVDRAAALGRSGRESRPEPVGDSPVVPPLPAGQQFLEDLLDVRFAPPSPTTRTVGWWTGRTTERRRRPGHWSRPAASSTSTAIRRAG